MKRATASFAGVDASAAAVEKAGATSGPRQLAWADAGVGGLTKRDSDGDPSDGSGFERKVIDPVDCHGQWGVAEVTDYPHRFAAGGIRENGEADESRVPRCSRLSSQTLRQAPSCCGRLP